MKKIISMASALVISCAAVSMTAFADDGETKVFVTVSDADSRLALVQEAVTVSDIDNDGKLTINDALYIAHENNFEGGAAAGYKSSITQYGLSLEKLWGTENGSGYGYYVNSAMSMSLADEIKNGDYIDAFVFPDPADLNYHYSRFDKRDGGVAEPDTEITLTLTYADFDANWNPIDAAVKGAKITINGKETDFITDDDGKAEIKLTDAGLNVISAVSDSVKIAPPSYIINVNGEAVTTSSMSDTTTTTTTAAASSLTTTVKTTAKTTAKAAATTKASNSPKTGDTGAGIAVFSLGAAAAAAFVLRRRNEK